MIVYPIDYVTQGALILGSGPGLVSVNMRLLADCTTVAFNRVYVSFEQWCFTPTYYVCIDRISLVDTAPEIASLVKTSQLRPLFLRDTAAERGAELGERVQLVHVCDEPVFGTDLQRLGMFNNVAAVSVQVLASLGHYRILMLGVDGRFKTHPTARTESHPWQARARADQNIDHFIPNYHGAGHRFTRPNPEKLMLRWEQLAEQLRGRDVQVRNATEGSAVGCLPRIGLEEGLVWIREAVV